MLHSTGPAFLQINLLSGNWQTKTCLISKIHLDIRWHVGLDCGEWGEASSWRAVDRRGGRDLEDVTPCQKDKMACAEGDKKRQVLLIKPGYPSALVVNASHLLDSRGWSKDSKEASVSIGHRLSPLVWVVEKYGPSNDQCRVRLGGRNESPDKDALDKLLFLPIVPERDQHRQQSKC